MARRGRGGGVTKGTVIITSRTLTGLVIRSRTLTGLVIRSRTLTGLVIDLVH